RRPRQPGPERLYKTGSSAAFPSPSRNRGSNAPVELDVASPRSVSAGGCGRVRQAMGSVHTPPPLEDELTVARAQDEPGCERVPTGNTGRSPVSDTVNLRMRLATA